MDVVVVVAVVVAVVVLEAAREPADEPGRPGTSPDLDPVRVGSIRERAGCGVGAAAWGPG